MKVKITKETFKFSATPSNAYQSFEASGGIEVEYDQETEGETVEKLRECFKEGVISEAINGLFQLEKQHTEARKALANTKKDYGMFGGKKNE